MNPHLEGGVFYLWGYSNTARSVLPSVVLIPNPFFGMLNIYEYEKSFKINGVGIDWIGEEDTQ
jgi:hypothetical protein